MTDTCDEIFLALRRAVHADSALQARLFGLSDAEEFISAILQLAHSQGHALQEEQVRQALRMERKRWSDRKLP